MYTRIFRTPKETSKIHQILAVLGKILFNQILAVLGELYLSTQMGAFLLVFRATHSVIARSKATWQSPGRESLS